MTDHLMPTGSTGMMMIRVTGANVQFWITSNNSTTFDYDLPWGYFIDGVTSPTYEYRYVANSGWQMLGSWDISYSQSLRFAIGATGTGGFGGPTLFNLEVDIASAQVNVDGTWESATPWVNVDGDWQQATIWVNVAGDWQQAG